ncbi:SDR family NAD(P)-dependent oxidoreductase, partial [Tabrizicola sp.]|uniref:SDR family NAD(P)-dependent oxidoreductase n=1 Tax=Tabrizicola sp. TaxID=2005166 RepID=UPI00286C3178
PLTVLQLDVQDDASISAAVADVIAREGRIDVLVNNAGAGFVRSLEQATMDEIAWVTDLNYMGVVRCTKAVLPHMRQARSGHVVTISSVGGLVGQPFNELYCGAKFAVEGFIEAMATYVTQAFGINFTIVEPGGISSEFAASALKQIQSTGGILDDEYRPILQAYIRIAQARQGTGSTFQTPDEVAEVVMATIATEKPPIRTRTSQWGETFTRLKTGLDPDGGKLADQVHQRMLVG